MKPIVMIYILLVYIKFTRNKFLLKKKKQGGEDVFYNEAIVRVQSTTHSALVSSRNAHGKIWIRSTTQKQRAAGAQWSRIEGRDNLNHLRSL